MTTGVRVRYCCLVLRLLLCQWHNIPIQVNVTGGFSELSAQVTGVQTCKTYEQVKTKLITESSFDFRIKKQLKNVGEIDNRICISNAPHKTKLLCNRYHSNCMHFFQNGVINILIFNMHPLNWLLRHYKVDPCTTTLCAASVKPQKRIPFKRFSRQGSKSFSKTISVGEILRLKDNPIIACCYAILNQITSKG